MRRKRNLDDSTSARCDGKPGNSCAGVAVLQDLELKLQSSPDRTIYVGDGSSDLYVMHHVNSHDGHTIAVSQTKSIGRIATRTVLSDNALSGLVPILEDILGWNAHQIRELFTSYGLALHDWATGIKSAQIGLHFTKPPRRSS
jgi:hypothetical protein